MTCSSKFALTIGSLAIALAGSRDASAQERQAKQQELKQRPSKSPEVKPQNPTSKDSAMQEPPEEDESLTPKEYSFNPLQAEKEIRIGNFYFKKGNYKAAAHRFSEATKWDSNSSEAYLRLGESQEKLKDRNGARDAYAKYLALAPDGKEAASIKKKMAGKQ